MTDMSSGFTPVQDAAPSFDLLQLELLIPIEHFFVQLRQDER